MSARRITRRNAIAAARGRSDTALRCRVKNAKHREWTRRQYMPGKRAILCLLLLFSLTQALAGEAVVPGDGDRQVRGTCEGEPAYRAELGKGNVEIHDKIASSEARIMELMESMTSRTIAGDFLLYYPDGRPEQWSDYHERRKREVFGVKPTKRDMELKSTDSEELVLKLPEVVRISIPLDRALQLKYLEAADRRICNP